MYKPKINIFSLTRLGDEYLDALKSALEKDNKTVFTFKEKEQVGGENVGKIQEAIANASLSILFCEHNDARMWNYIGWVRKAERMIVLVGKTPESNVAAPNEFDAIIPLERIERTVRGLDTDAVMQIDDIIRS